MLPHVGLMDRSHSLDRAALIGGREEKKACMRQKECIFHLNISKRINHIHQREKRSRNRKNLYKCKHIEHYFGQISTGVSVLYHIIHAKKHCSWLSKILNNIVEPE